MGVTIRRSSSLVTFDNQDADLVIADEHELLRNKYYQYLRWLQETVGPSLLKRFEHHPSHKDLALAKLDALYSALNDADEQHRFFQQYSIGKMWPKFNSQVESTIASEVNQEFRQTQQSQKKRQAKKTWKSYKKGIIPGLLGAAVFTALVILGSVGFGILTFGVGPFVIGISAGVGFALSLIVNSLLFSIATGYGLSALRKHSKIRRQMRTVNRNPHIPSPTTAPNLSHYIIPPTREQEQFYYSDKKAATRKINDQHMYTNEDIDTVMLAHIKQQGGFWHQASNELHEDFEFKHFLLKNGASSDGKFSESGQSFYSAYLPAVMIQLEKSKQGKEFCIPSGMSMSAYLNKYSEFAQQALGFANNPGKKDVFDELLPKMLNDIKTMESAQARLCFAFCIRNGHWINVEIHLTINSQNQVLVGIHFDDPKKEGNEQILHQLKAPNELYEQIQQRFKSDPLLSSQSFNFSLEPPRHMQKIARQHDKDFVSCGAIVLEGLMLRLQGQPYSQAAPYPVGAQELRGKQLSLVLEQFPLTTAYGRGFAGRNLTTLDIDSTALISTQLGPMLESGEESTYSDLSMGSGSPIGSRRQQQQTMSHPEQYKPLEKIV